MVTPDNFKPDIASVTLPSIFPFWENELRVNVKNSNISPKNLMHFIFLQRDDFNVKRK